MPYDATKDPHAETIESVMAQGAVGAAVTPSDSTDLARYPRAIVLLTAGNVSYIPAKNADGAPLSFVDLPAGWVSPHRVRRVRATGTTATIATVEG